MSRTRVIAIIQARMGSTRLPGKILSDVGGETMLARVVRRLRQADSLDSVVVATTWASGDDATVAECARFGVPTFRGDEQDVLDRYYRAAQAYRAQVIVRITADCPLIDPQVVDRVVVAFLASKVDYASNVLERTYPRGLDVEVMTCSALERAWQEAVEPGHRAHVTPYLYLNPHLFRLLSVVNDNDFGRYRWTVDAPEDLAFVREIYARFGGDDTVSWTDVLAVLEREPALVELNRGVRQKELREG